MKSIEAIFCFAAASLLGGCAITSSYKHGPDGGAVHMIDGMSASVAYRKADQLCPSGYTILAQQGQASVMDYVMTVECKMTEQIAPTAAAVSRQGNGIDPGMFSAAQNVAAGQYCNRAITSLFHQGDREMFEASGCPDGHAIQIDCRSGTCHELGAR